jgi:HlyD family secretion protein
MRVIHTVLPMLAVAGLGFSIARVPATAARMPTPVPLATPPESGFQRAVSGNGLVEPSSENISVGAPAPGLVTAVFVAAGQEVRAGEPLFQLDDRALRAEVAVRRAAVENVQQKLARLASLPRTEEVDALVAQVREAEASLADERAQLARREALEDLVAREELERRRFAVRGAEARLEAAQARMRLTRGGGWAADERVLTSELGLADAELAKAEVELARLTVRAPANGQCLQVRVRPGEYADPARGGEALILLGATNELNVRVEVDEYDAPNVREHAAAYAVLRGDGSRRLPLRFIRFEPYVVAKRALSSDGAERVDTRVLQVIYRIAGTADRVFPGQQVDVFIEAADR